MDISKGEATLGCNPKVHPVASGTADDEDDGIVNDIPRSAEIGCHGFRADRFKSLEVILVFRNDLKKIYTT